MGRSYDVIQKKYFMHLFYNYSLKNNDLKIILSLNCLCVSRTRLIARECHTSIEISISAHALIV